MSESPPLLPSADELDAILTSAGRTSGARIVGVTVENSEPTILSHIARLRLSYEQPTGDAPKTLFLKTSPAGGGNDVANARREIEFYARIAPRMPAGIVPRCYQAQCDDASARWRLILEDLSETHRVRTPWPLPPTPEDCRDVLSAWAKFHAAWWDAPALGVDVGTRFGPEEPRMEAFAERYERFAAALGERLSPERREIYRRLIAAGRRLGARHRSRRNMTLTHGDAHYWNVLLPNAPGDGARLIDWDAWRVDVAASDLAYMMSVHWFPDYRRRYEASMLDHYHAQLLSHGVAGYDRRALQDDYRLSTLWRVMTPVGQHAFGIPAGIWWNHLDRVFSAIDDLNCRELLD